MSLQRIRHATAVLLAALVCSACASGGRAYPEAEPDTAILAATDEAIVAEEPGEISIEAPEIEVPVAVAKSEPATGAPITSLPDVFVQGQRSRDEVIRDLVAEARLLLRDVRLEYFFTGKGRREKLRGRPVAFALWSDAKGAWTIAHVEIPPPPVRWRPGGRPLKVLVRTPGIKARHVKGTGAERLMLAFTAGDGEPLKVYGRKFPVFDNALLKKKRWRAVAATATPIVYLPFTTDTLEPGFVSSGREFLLDTATRAIEQLRAARVPSRAYPGELLADVVPAAVIATLAVIEQTDDADYVRKKAAAFEEVLSQYGLKREEAFRYSVSSAAALGPMQFTNRRGNGTYALVVRRCPGARLDPNFERGATDLLNAMKAAICLFDIELTQMRPEIRRAYRDNPAVLGIFPVAAYNGGPRNVEKLYRALRRMSVEVDRLRRVGEQPVGRPVACPCVWVQHGDDVRPLPIPRYNRENRGYIEKYQTLLAMME